ncbi:MAG: hypothetical protein ACRDQF_13205, partial [Thermocrispum sp.]
GLAVPLTPRHVNHLVPACQPCFDAVQRKVMQVRARRDRLSRQAGRHARVPRVDSAQKGMSVG